MRGIAMLGIALVFAGSAASQSPPPAQLSISDAIAYAKRHSPALKGAKAELAAAGAELGVARARTGPQLALHGFLSKGDMPSILQSSMGVEPPSFVMAPAEPFRDLSLMLMVPLFTGGYLSGLVGEALALHEAATSEFAEWESEVALSVRSAFLSALYATETIESKRASVAAADAMVQNAKARYEAGKAVEASFSRAQAELAEARLELAMAENEQKKALLELLAAMGAPLDSEISLTGKLEPGAVQLSLEDAVRVAKEQRPMVRSARRRAASARAKLRSAEGSRLPQAYGFAMGESFSPRDAMNRDGGYTVGLTLSLPLFDSGMRRSEIARAKAMAERAESEARKAEIEAEKDVRMAWLDFENAQVAIESSRAGLIAAQAAYDIAVIRVENDKAILVEQLDAFAALSRARANLARAQFDRELALARLDRAMGRPTGEGN